MRHLVSLFFTFLISLSAYAAEDFVVRVTDPQSDAVAGARVNLYPNAGNRLISAQSTNAEGKAAFKNLSAGDYRVEALAPGFAAQTSAVSLPAGTIFSISLRVEERQETVIVTATQTPLPMEQTGASAAVLDYGALTALQPVSINEAVRFLPGAVVNGAGRRGALSSLFVRGGDSRYNKVIVDGVTVNEPGGVFDFGVVPLTEAGRIEFVRGAESTLYGSDALTSVVQVFTAAGKTRTPELRIAAEGGTFSTSRGSVALSGARGRIDYNLFGEQFDTAGQGINDDHANSSQGANIGVALTDKVGFRLRTRHSNSRTGVQSFFNFNGQPLLAPDSDQFARQNNFLASAELSVAAPGQWQHRFTGFEYNHLRSNSDRVADVGRVSPAFGPIDFPFESAALINRAGFEYQGEFQPRSWARSTFNFRYENENGLVGDRTAPPLTRGVRQNYDMGAQQWIQWNRLTLISGFRVVKNDSFGTRVVPRVVGAVAMLRGGRIFSGTNLRAAFGEGIKEPTLEESFGIGGFFIDPNPNLKPERNRSYEAGISQSLLQGRASFAATYYHNLFRNQIAFSFDPATFASQFVNINRALAHGAELELHAHPLRQLSLDAAYTYTSTQILRAPLAFDPLLTAGSPLLRRPRHSGNMLLAYNGKRWGGNLGGSFIGARADSDFSGFGVDHAAGYARFDIGGWYALNPRVTAYINVENALNRKYEEVAGYPALKANFRAGMRFQIGGE